MMRNVTKSHRTEAEMKGTKSNDVLVNEKHRRSC
jgi:hypothetical protein